MGKDGVIKRGCSIVGVILRLKLIQARIDYSYVKILVTHLLNFRFYGSHPHLLSCALFALSPFSFVIARGGEREGSLESFCFQDAGGKVGPFTL